MSLNKIGPTFEQQTDITISQANPVSTTVYPVSGAQQNVKIYLITAFVTGAGGTDLRVTVVLDGITFIFIIANPGDGTEYYVAIDPNAAANAQDLDENLTTGQVMLVPHMLEGRRLTSITAVCTHGGAVTNLDVVVKWKKKG